MVFGFFLRLFSFLRKSVYLCALKCDTMRELTNFKYRLGAFVLVFLAIVWLSWGTGILHDNVTFVSHMSSSLQASPFAWGCIPMQYDPGHPPFTASYLCLVWQFFGRSLAVSHLALYPFVLLTLLMLMRLVSRFVSLTDLDKSKIDLFSAVVFALCAMEPTFAASLTLIGPEVFLLCFALMAIVFMLEQCRLLFVCSVAILGITSMRGMMVSAGICLADMLLLYLKDRKIKPIFSRLYQYLIAAVPAVAFVLWRLVDKGWITSNPVAFQESVWPDGGVVGFTSNFIHNVVVLIRWLLDFGRIVPVLLTLWLLSRGRKQWVGNKTVSELLVLMFVPTFIVITTSLLIHNTMGHRYFTITYVMVVLLFSYLVLSNRQKHRAWLLALVAVAFLGGNLMVYPDNISQGWDASLAHIHYWKVRQQALDYMEENQIAPDQICKYGFGNSNDDSDLGGDVRRYKITNDCPYAMCSNIDNLPDNDLAYLEKEYTRLKRFQKMGVWIDLLKRNSQD